MGIVFDPEDALKGKKNMFKRALRDLDPSLREPVKLILEDWEGKPSEKKLVRLVGKEKARIIIKNY